MAHFAQIDENNVVLTVVVVPNDQEFRGQEYLSEDLNLDGTWLKTSYNTLKGVYYKNRETGEIDEDQSKAFRKNYAVVGFTYDEQRDAFIPPKPYPSWTFNEESCWWDSPVPMPENGVWSWNEELQQWE